MGVSERLGVLRNVGSGGANGVAKAAASRLAAWRLQRALDEQRGLHDPGAIYGCSDDELREVLAGSRIPQGIENALPWWARRLNDAWTRGQAANSGRSNAASNTAIGEPGRAFVPIVGPFAADAVERVTADAIQLAGNVDGAPFSVPKVVAALHGSLVTQLAALVTRVGVLELQAARLNGELIGDTPHDRFVAFTRRIRDPIAAEAILRRSPVLARLAFAIADNWVESSREFLSRLCGDWAELRESFGFSNGDEVVEILVMGDLHCGGRAVLDLRFASGRRLIYKPRAVDAETQFQRLLDWLCAQSGFPDLRRLTIVAKPTHGWVEYVEPQPCPNNEVATLYRRYGATLAVLHTLAATDCHFQNIVAAGAYPVVVDLEALFHAFPSADLSHLGAAEQAALQSTASSVLTVGLLPMRRWSNASARSVDISGLGARADEWAEAKAAHWENEFTDEMREVLKRPKALLADEPEENEQDALLDFVDDIADGFAAAYRVLLANRDELLEDDGLLAGFDRLETRSVLRPTGHYAFILQSVSHPSFLDDGVRLDQRFDRLISADDERPANSPVTASERADLWRMDVPMFRTRPGSRDLWCSDDNCIPAFLAETGLERARHRMATLSRSDLEHQLWLIRLSIATWAINRRDVSEGDKKAPLALRPEVAVDELAFSHALAIRLRELAIRRDGDATWIGTRYRAGDDTWTVDAVSPNLFDGVAGIILFLAYIARTADERQHLELAREGLRTFERQIDGAVSAAVPRSLGGFSGVGGWIHTLTHLGVLWNDDRLLQRASDLVPSLRAGLESATTVDIIGGAAGSVRPLLNLYDLTHSDQVLDCAVACGDHVLAAAEPQANGFGWQSPAGPLPLTGFAHGAAGISWALLKLYNATGNESYRNAALAGIAYERSLFSASERNWRDLRGTQAAKDTEAASCAYFWCHGSAGIGLGRLDNLTVQSDKQTHAEIEAAVTTTAAHGFRSDHSLCHGYASAAELMMLAAKAGITTPPPPTGSSWAQSMLHSIRRDGCVTGCPLGIEIPGLMMGVAGIGYGLLRLSEPERVPSVLLLEPPQAR